MGLWDTITTFIDNAQSVKWYYFFCSYKSPAISNPYSFSTLLWRIWRNLHDLIWDGKHSTLDQIVCNGKHFLSDWVQAKTIVDSRFQYDIQNHSTGWSAPPVGLLKCNIDAAFQATSNVTGWLSCRDEREVSKVIHSMITRGFSHGIVGLIWVLLFFSIVCVLEILLEFLLVFTIWSLMKWGNTVSVKKIIISHCSQRA